MTLAASLATFAVVQDRVTAAGARQYVALQKEAGAGLGRPVTVQEVMAPAIRESVRRGAMAGGGVLLAGVLLMIARRRR